METNKIKRKYKKERRKTDQNMMKCEMTVKMACLQKVRGVYL